MSAAKARAWFFPTSPRSPYLLQEELRLLSLLEGQIWNTQTQYRFAELLAESRGHSVSAFRDPPLTARDRVTRAPRLLGLVHLPERGQGTPLHLTRAGRQLLELEDPTYLYQRQLAKVQFSSPLHRSRGFENMQIRPMTAMCAILKEVDALSKEEIALFVVTTTDYQRIRSTVDDIHAYREGLRNSAPGRSSAETGR
jgi:AlwI restriction endonuclease